MWRVYIIHPQPLSGKFVTESPLASRCVQTGVSYFAFPTGPPVYRAHERIPRTQTRRDPKLPGRTRRGERVIVRAYTSNIPFFWPFFFFPPAPFLPRRALPENSREKPPRAHSAPERMYTRGMIHRYIYTRRARVPGQRSAASRRRLPYFIRITPRQWIAIIITATATTTTATRSPCGRVTPPRPNMPTRRAVNSKLFTSPLAFRLFFFPRLTPTE